MLSCSELAGRVGKSIVYMVHVYIPLGLPPRREFKLRITAAGRDTTLSPTIQIRLAPLGSFLHERSSPHSPHILVTLMRLM